jgi:hypothetical protein
MGSPFVARVAAARLVSRDVTSTTVAVAALLAARSSGVPFFDGRGMITRATAGNAAAFAARSSGVPFFDLRGRLAAARFFARLAPVLAFGKVMSMVAPSRRKVRVETVEEGAIVRLAYFSIRDVGDVAHNCRHAGARGRRRCQQVVERFP